MAASEHGLQSVVRLYVRCIAAIVAVGCGACAAQADVHCTKLRWEPTSEGDEALISCGTQHGVTEGMRGTFVLADGSSAGAFVVSEPPDTAECWVHVTSLSDGVDVFGGMSAKFDGGLGRDLRRFPVIATSGRMADVGAGSRQGVARDLRGQVFRVAHSGSRREETVVAELHVAIIESDRCTAFWEPVGSGHLVEEGMTAVFFGLGEPHETESAGASLSRIEELEAEQQSGTGAEARRLDAILRESKALVEAAEARELQRSALMKTLAAALRVTDPPAYDYEGALAALRALGSDPAVAQFPELRTRIETDVADITERKDRRDGARARVEALALEAVADLDARRYDSAVRHCDDAIAEARARPDLRAAETFFDQIGRIRNEARASLAMRQLVIGKDTTKPVKRNRNR